jgi:hypothetical protein
MREERRERRERREERGRQRGETGERREGDREERQERGERETERGAHSGSSSANQSSSLFHTSLGAWYPLSSSIALCLAPGFSPSIMSAMSTSASIRWFGFSGPPPRSCSSLLAPMAAVSPLPDVGLCIGDTQGKRIHPSTDRCSTRCRGRRPSSAAPMSECFCSRCHQKVK